MAKMSGNPRVSKGEQSKPQPRGGSKPSTEHKDSAPKEFTDEESVMLRSVLRQCAEECGLLEEFRKKPTVGSSAVGKWGDGVLLSKFLEFIAKIGPLIIPLILKEDTSRKTFGATEFDASGEPTLIMGLFGIDFTDITGMVEHVVKLLEDQGENVLSIVKGLLSFVRAVSQRDLASIFAIIQQEKVDIQELITAIKDEFGID